MCRSSWRTCGISASSSRSAAFGEGDALATAIARRAPALDQAGALEPIEQCHDAGLVDAEMRAELDLRDAGIGAHQAQQAEQSRPDLVLADEADVGAPRGLAARRRL